MHRKLKNLLIYSFLLLLFGVVSSSCSKKTGCPMNDPDKVGAKTSKKGALSTKKGSSSLFPKKMKKKKRRN